MTQLFVWFSWNFSHPTMLLIQLENNDRFECFQTPGQNASDVHVRSSLMPSVLQLLLLPLPSLPDPSLICFAVRVSVCETKPLLAIRSASLMVFNSNDFISCLLRNATILYVFRLHRILQHLPMGARKREVHTLMYRTIPYHKIIG